MRRALNPRFEPVTVTGCCSWWGVSGGHNNTVVTSPVSKVNDAPWFKDAGQVKEAMKNPRRNTPDTGAGGAVVATTEVEEVDELSGEPGAVEVVIGSVMSGDEAQAV